LLFVLAAAFAGPVFAQPSKTVGPPADRAASGKADQAEGARILAEFQRSGIAGDYWLEFELRVLPRRGQERVIPGVLLGTRGPDGPVSLVNVAGERWLIASGPRPEAWRTTGGTPATAPPAEALAGTGITVFDLQMPFLYWRDFVYEGKAVIRGRPAHSFILRPPAGDPAAAPAGLTGVRVLLDVEFQALVQAEELGPDNTVLKTIALLELKKSGEQWLVKTIDVRDTRTRDKTRFTVRAAALGLAWPRGTFSPGSLDAALPPVPPERITRF
jgi:hypothetical protein